MYLNVPECQFQNLDIQFAGHENLPTAHEAVSDNAGITNFSKSNFVFQQNPISYFIKIHLDSMFISWKNTCTCDELKEGQTICMSSYFNKIHLNSMFF